MEKVLHIDYINCNLVSVNKAMGIGENKYGVKYKYIDKDYANMRNMLLHILPVVEIKKDVPLRIEYDFYTARTNSDVDNLIKCLQDILQKKYNFDDRNFYEIEAKKYPVGKKNEGFGIRIFEIKIPKIKNNLELTKDKNIGEIYYE